MIGFNTLWLGQNARHFGMTFSNEFCVYYGNVYILIKKKTFQFVPRGPITNIPALVKNMAYPGDKPLFETVIVS